MKYRAKPIEVEAVEWTGTSESWAALCELVGGDVIFRNPDDTLSLEEVDGGHVRIRVGNWVVKSEIALGSFEGDVFTAIYEPVLELGKGAADAD